MHISRRTLNIYLGSGLLAGVQQVHAQSYPDRPIRMVIPFSAGGTSDVIGRILAQHLSTALGTQVVVDNRAGANGNIGTDIALKSPADGYTLLLSFDGTMAINPSTYKKLPFDPQRDAAPIINAAQAGLVMVVGPSVNAKTIQEFVAYAKSTAAPLFYSSAGNGSTGHLAGELFAARAGIKMSHVPYKGGAPALQDLLAGQIPFLVTAIPTIQGLMGEGKGKVRPLAVTTSKRLRALPNVPALAEIYPGYEVNSWYGLFAPANTPAAVIQRLNSEVEKALAKPEVREKFDGLGLEAVGGSPQSLSEKVKVDTRTWAEVVKRSNIQVD
jgi:tripartite-type tricarboxylate transporter receptor subunit TctC